MTRTLMLLATVSLLSACGGGAVDVTTLPPLSGQEIALITSGDVAARQGNNAQAERNYADAVARSKGRVEAHLALAAFYAHTGEPAKAKAVLERANRLQPEHPRVAYMLAKIYLTENRLEDAVKVLDPALAAHPSDLELLTAEGIAHDMIPKHVQAQSYYLRAQRLNPKADLTTVRTNLAMSYLLTGKAEMTVELLTDDAARPDASAVTRHNLALAYGVLGRDDEAREVLRGELSEAERVANVARIKEYVASRRGM